MHPQGSHCCLGLDLADRELAAEYRLACSPSHCCRAQLGLIRAVLADLDQFAGEQDDGTAA